MPDPTFFCARRKGYFFFFCFRIGLGEPMSKSTLPPFLPALFAPVLGFLTLLFLFAMAVSSTNASVDLVVPASLHAQNGLKE